MGKKILITQSNYIPWKGYFDAIAMVDEFVLYDCVQYTRRDWRNRNKIKTANGTKWLTIPVEVKGKYYQLINETKISDPDWGKKHWQNIVENYSKAPHFNELKPIFEPLYLQQKNQLLTQINLQFISSICEILNIGTIINRSSNYKLVDGQNERLISICKQANATEYYTGAAAKNYLDENLFLKSGIKVIYLDYSGYPEYQQFHPPFEHSVTTLDLLFNTGSCSHKYMKHLKTPAK